MSVWRWPLIFSAVATGVYYAALWLDVSLGGQVAWVVAWVILRLILLVECSKGVWPSLGRVCGITVAAFAAQAVASIWRGQDAATEVLLIGLAVIRLADFWVTLVLYYRRLVPPNWKLAATSLVATLLLTYVGFWLGAYRQQFELGEWSWACRLGLLWFVHLLHAGAVWAMIQVAVPFGGVAPIRRSGWGPTVIRRDPVPR